MFREGDSFVLLRVTGGLRKPIVRFRLASARQIELLGFHLEPAWAFTGDGGRPIIAEVIRRLYPNERVVVVNTPDRVEASAFLCLAHLCSDTPVIPGSSINYSVLVLCGLVEKIDKGVRGIVSELLSQVDWETTAVDDLMW
jgi:hypothetical protein